MSSFQERIQYKGDEQILFNELCDDYQLGTLIRAKPIEVGYEDFNVVVETSSGKYFAKFFASFRNVKDCQRYVDTMKTVTDAGIQHPRLIDQDGKYLHTLTINSINIPVCVMEFIEGNTFHDLNTQPSHDELMFLMQQASIINQLQLKPESVYDSWACVNFLNEFNNKKQHLSIENRELIEPLVDKYNKINLDELPHAFVHGDIINTNVMRSKDKQIYILDFSVSNWYPRIQELAILFCDLFFNKENHTNFPELFKEGIFEYQKTAPLIHEELEILPLYVKVAHAMHIICANYEKVVNGNNSEENDSWLMLGEQGLHYTSELWK